MSPWPAHRAPRTPSSPDVRTGQVLGEDITRNDPVTFIAFPRLLEHAVPADSTIHLILDNGSSHTSKATRSWPAKPPRFVVHHPPSTPPDEFDSHQDLVEQIREFTLAYDDPARPFGPGVGSGSGADVPPGGAVAVIAVPPRRAETALPASASAQLP
ncbi:hypothetical protein [Streptomyces sp. 150FB]|uniref:hypothetical protein n=1 Tax=Streptomyces sp. 150FB TaxID=1576605 RepID=UPI000AAE1DB2|nr:hypothetical protein [Streptomyces sp. 150FB]